MIDAIDITKNTPLVVITSTPNENFSFYLSAIRSGASDFLVTPVSEQKLAEKLSKFSEEKLDHSLAVLIVDDDLALAENYSLILRKSGIISKIVSDPTQIFPILESFMPDVLFLDVWIKGIFFLRYTTKGLLISFFALCFG